MSCLSSGAWNWGVAFLSPASVFGPSWKYTDLDIVTKSRLISINFLWSREIVRYPKEVAVLVEENLLVGYLA